MESEIHAQMSESYTETVIIIMSRTIKDITKGKIQNWISQFITKNYCNLKKTKKQNGNTALSMYVINITGTGYYSMFYYSLQGIYVLFEQKYFIKDLHNLPTVTYEESLKHVV